VVLQGMTYGAGFLIMINYIYNQLYTFARLVCNGV
ncbi:uncharacterized protein METZ01_LOCUS428419, partial [marine metagenome]